MTKPPSPGGYHLSPVLVKLTGESSALEGGAPTHLHVRIEVHGSVEFELEGQDALNLWALLQGDQPKEVIDYLDPFSSDVELRQDVMIDDLTSPRSRNGDRGWFVREEEPHVRLIKNGRWLTDWQVQGS